MAYYPGLGKPISQFGYDPNGQPSLGPYSFLSTQNLYSGITGAGNARPGSTGQSTTTSTTTPGPNPAEGWLQGVLDGKELPYSPTTTGAMLSGQSDMNGAAESAQNAAMASRAAAGGASAFDPSFAAGKAATMARRQTANQTAKRDIDAKAGTANFGAKLDAAGLLSNNALTRELASQRTQQSNMNAALQFMPWNQPGGYSQPGRMNANAGNFIQFGATPPAKTNPYAQVTQDNYYNVPDDYDEVMGTYSADSPAGYR